METLQGYDQGLLYYFESLHRPWLDPIVAELTHLGDSKVLGGITLAVVGFFLLIRQLRLAGVLVGVAVAAAALHYAVKYLVQRPRPDVAWRLIDLPHEPSFPSGHAMCSMAIYGCMGLLAGRLLPPPWRWLVIAAGFILGLVVGLTRPYLGVHYPLDVLAGWIAGLAFALLGALLAEPRKNPALHRGAVPLPTQPGRS